MKIGEFLVIKRKQLGLSQRQLAILSGINYVQINRYEKNLSIPNPKNLQKLAGGLKLPDNFFLDNQSAAAIAKELLIHRIETICQLEIDPEKINFITVCAKLMMEGATIPAKKKTLSNPPRGAKTIRSTTKGTFTKKIKIQG